LPLTYEWDPVVSMYVFAGIIGAAGRGGSITAIALNMPGTAQNAATTLDGYPLTRQGRISWALAVAASSSMLGATAGILLLVICIPVFIPFLLAFGPAELCWVMVLGVVSMAVALPGRFLKVVVAVGIGMILATVGYGGPTLSVPRFTFGSTYMLDGFSIVAVIIGLLVVSQAFVYLIDGLPTTAKGEPAPQPPPSSAHHWRETKAGLIEPLRHKGLLLRSSAIGTLIGAIPGVGGTVAQFFSYNAAYAASRNKEMFGKGSVEGLIAAETAVDAKEGGTLMPTLLFGIPGNGEMALVLAAWELHGLQAGPFFLQENPSLAWALILGLFFSNVLATVLQLGCNRYASRIPSLRPDHVALAVLVLSVLALLSVRQNLWDAGFVIVIGAFGYLLNKLGFPVIGTVIGFVLGNIMEWNFYTALQSGYGNYATFFSSPTSIGLCVATVAVILYAAYRRMRQRSLSNSG
jgi:putative tricarboxylic transport membrane protein